MKGPWADAGPEAEGAAEASGMAEWTIINFDLILINSL
jgi:hypothetical protein